MNSERTHNKPGPKPEPYTIDDPAILKIPGTENITTAKQYQKLLSYLTIPVGDRNPCSRIGATVPPSPQMSRNASAKLKITRIFKEHEVKYSMQYKSPRCFIMKITSGKITEALIKDLRDTPETTVTIDETGKGAVTIWIDFVDDNTRDPSQSIWVVTYPSGKVEVIKRLQDPRAAHRWMTNEQRPWNNKVAPAALELSQI